MGSKDVSEKILEAYNEVFADIVNALLFKGKQVVNENDLVDAQPVSSYKLADELKWQERDVAKYWLKNKMRISCFGLENQTKVDYAMPIRTMNYDATEYYKQVNSGEPYYPVITIVLHFGTKRRWTEKKSLFGLLGDSVTQDIQPFINDYKINVFDLAWLTDEEILRFKSDFKLVVEYLQAERVGNVKNWGRQKLFHIHELLNLLKSISHDETFTKMEDFIVQTQSEKGGIQVSEFVQKWFNQGRNEGIALGRNEGIALGRNEGIALGRNEGISSMQAIMSKLYAEGRDADVKRAFTDSTYLAQLLSDYKK